MSQTLVSEDEDVIVAMERHMQSRADAVFGSTDTTPRRTATRSAAAQARLQGMYDASKNRPKASVKHHLGRGVVWTVLFALLIAAFSGLFGATTASADDDDEELNDRSFYNLSSHLTEFFSSLQEPGSDQQWGDYTNITSSPGTAGSFIGYLDVSFLDDPSNWAISNLSGSSSAMSYDTFEVKDEDGNVTSDLGTGFQDYAHLGAALNDAGFDSTSTGLSLSMGNVIMGGLMMGAWVLSYVVDFTFWLFIQLLQVLNPFGWFYLGIEDALGTNAAEGAVGGAGDPTDSPIIGTALEGLITWIGSWYGLLYSMSWQILVPVFLGVLAMSLLLVRNLDRGSAIKKFFIRILFIVFGVPLLGSLYAGVLNALSDSINPSATGSTQVVMSTFVDFETWAREGRLNIPDGATIEWDTETNGVSDATLMNLRNTALEINAQSYSGLDVTMLDSHSAEDQNSQWTDAQLPDADDEDLSSADFNNVMNMLWRFISADQVTAASFETEMKAWMSTNKDWLEGKDSLYYDHPFTKKLDSDGVIALFDHVANPDDVEGKALGKEYDGNAMYSKNPLVAVEGDTGLTDLHSGLTGGHNAGVSHIKSFQSDGTRDRCYAEVFSSSGEPLNCNLAPLAMFNYLNTSFDSTALTTYSSGNVMSEATRSIHNSVNTTGTGVMSFVIWINSMTLLVSFILIGFGYAFAMLFGAIKRTFQIVSAIPFGAIGVLSGIAKIIIYTFALIIQTLVTVFIYMFVQEFLQSLPQIIEMPFASLIDWSDGGVLGFMSGSVITIITMLLSIVATIAFTVVALRVRGSVVKGLEEVITKLIERFTGANSGGAPGAPSAGGGGPVQGAMAGVGAGMGGAAANRMMTNRSSGGSGPGTGGGGTNVAGTNGPGGPGTDGPAKLASASGPGGVGPYGGKSSDQLSAEEQNTISNGVYGSPDPNSPDYDPNHPMSPDYAGGTEVTNASETGRGTEHAGTSQEDDLTSADQMGTNSDDVHEGQRISHQGLALDGNEQHVDGDQTEGDRANTVQAGDSVDAGRDGDAQHHNATQHAVDQRQKVDQEDNQVDMDQSRQTQLASGQQPDGKTKGKTDQPDNSQNPGGARPVAGTEKSDLWNIEGAASREVGNKVIDKTVKDPEKRDKMKYQQQRTEGVSKSMKQGAAKGAAKGFIKGGAPGAVTGAATGGVKGVAKNEVKHRRNVKAHNEGLKRSGGRQPAPQQSQAPKPAAQKPQQTPKVRRNRQVRRGDDPKGE